VFAYRSTNDTPPQLLVLDHPLARSIGFLEGLKHENGTFFLYMD